MLTTFWWSPLRDLPSLASEARHHALAWTRMLARGGGVANFGDELSRLAVREATGRAVKWRGIRRADLIAIGSILDLYLTRGGSGLVWGSGLRDPDVAPVGDDVRSRVLAVRGHLTRRALGLPDRTPVGDPGLLARAIYTRPVKRSGVVVLPHFSVFQHAEGGRTLRALESEGMRIVAPSSDVDVVCRAIAGAEHVLTSSLHGVVVSDALDTPVTLVSFVDSREPRFKYDDYSSAFGETAEWVGASELGTKRGVAAARAAAESRKDRIAPVVDQIVEGLLRAAKGIS